MKTKLLTIFLMLGMVFLAQAKDYKPIDETKAKLILKSKSQQAINLVFLGDGFTREDIQNGSYEKLVRSFVQKLFLVPPFQQFKKYFNVYMVFSESKERGADVEDEDTKDTVFDSTFDNSNLLTIRNYDLAEEHVRYATDKAHSIIVIVNDEQYGGSGSDRFAVASTNAEVFKLILHEFGHSFAGLGDEYYYEDTKLTYKPEELVNLPGNVDTARDPKQIKWAHLIGLEGYENVGVFEGGLLAAEGVFRSQKNCMMNSMEYSYCHLCRELITKTICKWLGKEYSFEEFITRNPIYKDSIIYLENPVNCYGEKIEPYEVAQGE